jgi:NitT/TauT family transport system substrate-binding protein
MKLAWFLLQPAVRSIFTGLSCALRTRLLTKKNPMVPRSRKFCMLTLAGAALFLAFSRSSASGSPENLGDEHAAPKGQKVGFQLDWYPTAEHGGHFQALVKNYYGDAGLDVDILDGGPGANGIIKVATGRVEFAMGRCDDVILAVKQGLPLLIVCAQMQHDPEAIMVHEGSPVRSFKDLDGHTVMCNVGQGWIAFLESRYGIKLNLIPMDYGMAQFIADKDFIQQCFISNEPYLALEKGVRTRSLLIANGGYDPYRVIFTSQAFARLHPDAVRSFVAGTIRGYREFLHGDAKEARRVIQERNASETPGVIEFAINAMKEHGLIEGDPAKGESTGLITRARMEAMIQVMVQLKALEAPIALERFVSFDFLPAETPTSKG